MRRESSTSDWLRFSGQVKMLSTKSNWWLELGGALQETLKWFASAAARSLSAKGLGIGGIVELL